MGIHIGKAEVRDGDYLARHTLNRVARIMSAGHGGQILLSRAVHEQVQDRLQEEVGLTDLGEHYLKGISQSEHIFQGLAPGLKIEFPPLVTKHSPRGYKLPEQIDAGGFGSVYRAFQPEVNREVAVKIILPQFANDPDFIRRFEFEAQTVACLEHPYIVPLYDLLTGIRQRIPGDALGAQGKPGKKTGRWPGANGRFSQHGGDHDQQSGQPAVGGWAQRLQR